jgi:hypothetical protein
MRVRTNSALQEVWEERNIIRLENYRKPTETKEAMLDGFLRLDHEALCNSDSRYRQILCAKYYSVNECQYMIGIDEKN